MKKKSQELEIEEPVENQPIEVESQSQSPFWLVGTVLVTFVGLFWRFWQIELKPLHHDEGVNGYFLTKLLKEGIYQYDPTNYHGPTLYFISFAFTKLFGYETFSVRASVAIFGVLIVLMACFLRRYIGNVGSLFAALMLALSPGMVFISRYYIHEIFFVFCSFGVVLGILYFLEGRKAGIFATASMSVLLLVSFMPSLRAANAFSDNETIVLAIRIGLLLVAAFLVFMIMKMLLEWNDGKPIYLMLASASLALFFATKETAFITLGTFVIAILCVWLWLKLKDKNLLQSRNLTIIFAFVTLTPILAGLYFYLKNSERFYDEFEAFKDIANKFLEKDATQQILFYTIILLGAISILTWIYFVIFPKQLDTKSDITEYFADLSFASFREKLGVSTDLALVSLAVIFVFIYIFVLFFSSFFTYPDGINKAFEAYTVWTKTGRTDHKNGLLAYVKWILQIESPILFLSAIGTLIAFIKAKHKFAMFTGLWAFGLFLAYMLIPYKTPWLALSFTLPMCLIAGYGINELFISGKYSLKILAGILALGTFFLMNFQSYDLNFLRYDDDSMPYVYAHTKRGFLDLIKEVERYADKSGKGKDATIEIVSSEYWSMPWYMRNYEHANFHGHIVESNSAEMIVGKADEQENELLENYAAHYKYVGKYPLRPGVDLLLLVRKDLADKNAKELYQMDGIDILDTIDVKSDEK